MTTKYLEVGDADWGVLVCYHFYVTDYDEIWSYCRSFGLSKERTREALRVLREPNTGMTISSDEIRMSIVFVGDATSTSEWWDTLSHELWHVVTHIIDYYGVGYDTEDAAYLTGFLMKQLVEEVGEPCY